MQTHKDNVEKYILGSKKWLIAEPNGFSKKSILLQHIAFKISDFRFLSEPMIALLLYPRPLFRFARPLL